MAIYGIGAYYDIGDVSPDFIQGNFAGTGWPITDAPELHAYFKTLKVGDIVYIKAANFGADITVKAIGIISDDQILDANHPSGLLEVGRNVKWVFTQKFVITKPVEKNNVRSNTVYEEFNADVQKQIISRIG